MATHASAKMPCVATLSAGMRRVRFERRTIILWHPIMKGVARGIFAPQFPMWCGLLRSVMTGTLPVEGTSYFKQVTPRFCADTETPTLIEELHRHVRSSG